MEGVDLLGQELCNMFVYLILPFPLTPPCQYVETDKRNSCKVKHKGIIPIIKAMCA